MPFLLRHVSTELVKDKPYTDAALRWLAQSLNLSSCLYINRTTNFHSKRYKGKKKKRGGGGGGGRNATFSSFLLKYRGQNTTFFSLLLKYRGRNYTNFPEKGGSKWRNIYSNLHRVSTSPGDLVKSRISEIGSLYQFEIWLAHRKVSNPRNWQFIPIWNLIGTLTSVLPRCLSNFRVIRQF